MKYTEYEYLYKAIQDVILDGHYNYLKPEIKEEWTREGNRTFKNE